MKKSTTPAEDRASRDTFGDAGRTTPAMLAPPRPSSDTEAPTATPPSAPS